MADARQFDLLLLRYAPHAITDEFATIGVMLLDAAPSSSPANGADAPSGAFLRFTRDWRRVRCLDPDADIEMLSALEDDLRRQLTSGPLDRATVMAKLQDYCSNGLRFTEPKACLAEDPQRELETLARLYLEHRRPSARERSARQEIVGRMKDAFEQAGVWGRMLKRIVAAEYTFAGDPLRIDCGYTVDGRAEDEGGPRVSAAEQPPAGRRVQLFHAVSLASDLDSAKILAFTFPQLREGIAHKERRRAAMTAITDDGLDLGDPGVAFALATLQRSEIAVARAADLPQISARARVELGI